MRLFAPNVSIALLLSVPFSAFAVTFNGRVVSDQGRPVANVNVSVQATTATVSNKTGVLPQPYFAKTDSQGLFSVALSGIGSYSVCVGAPGLLNSCEWDLTQSTFKIGSQPTAIQVITLQTGIPVNIRLDDPGALLPQPGLPGNASVSFIVLESNGHSHRATQPSVDNKGFNYQVLVPAGASNLRFSVLARNVNVLDQNNNIANAAAFSAQPILSNFSQVLHFQVVPIGN